MARKHRKNNEFESLLAEYSNFKEKQVHKKAKKLLSKHHSTIKMTRKKKSKKNRHLEMIENGRSFLFYIFLSLLFSSFFLLYSL